LIVTTEILLEYEEKLKQKYSLQVATDFLDAMDIAVNVINATSYYQWHLIKDTDDNKFTDCAIAAGADYLSRKTTISNVLKKSEFPKVSVISLNQFKAMLEI
jgi:predicted nucleic acid-binding protein